MKKILVVSVMALGLVMLSPSAHAVIYEVEVVAEHASRDFEIEMGGTTVTLDATTLGFWVQLTVEAMEGLDVYLKLGNASIGGELLGGIISIDGDMDISQGLGVRYTIPMNDLGLMPGIGEATEVGVGLEWINLSSDFDAFTVVFPYPGDMPAGTFEISGWSFSLFASEDMGMFVPYLGLRYSDMELLMEDPGGVMSGFDAANNFEIFLGADIPMGFANINVEVGFLDETSFRIGASFAL